MEGQPPGPRTDTGRKRDTLTSRDTVMGKIRAALADDAPPIPIPRDYIRGGRPIRAAAPSSNCWWIGSSTTGPWSTKSPPAACRRPGRRTVRDASVVIAHRPGPRQSPTPARESAGPSPSTPPRTSCRRQELDAIDAVVTTARVAIAMSGTIILDGGAGQGRRAITLVPDRHIVILTADQIVETVAEAIPLLNPTAPAHHDRRPVRHQRHRTRTGRRVHGPRTLHVIIIRGSPD